MQQNTTRTLLKNYRILKSIRDSGHEIGYHSEIVDQAAIWDEMQKNVCGVISMC